MSLEPKTTIFARFLKEMDEIGQASPHTLKAYKKDLEQAFEGTLDLPLPNESELLHQIKEAQIKWGALQLASRQRKAATMKAFLDWLFRRKLITSPLNERIESPKVPRKIPNYLSVDEVLHLFEYVKTFDTNDPKKNFYIALLFLLYGGGLRVSEACHLRWDRIRLNSSEVCILGKGSKERWVALPNRVGIVIRALPKLGDYIWGHQPLNERIAYSWVRKLGKESGLRTPLHPHALRHSYATHLVSAGINLRTLQELMGHSSLASTEKYMHLSIDQLARTLESHHPLARRKGSQ
jgi:integrase/recombinase XerC/integrase/recombinase XerD